eukprot:3047239-Karenia_brevis.AAC.1
MGTIKVDTISHLIWADNLWVFSESEAQLHAMLTELTDALEAWDLQWKPEALEILACNVTEDLAASIVIQSAKGNSWDFKYKDNIHILGDA